MLPHMQQGSVFPEEGIRFCMAAAGLGIGVSDEKEQEIW